MGRRSEANLQPAVFDVSDGVDQQSACDGLRAKGSQSRGWEVMVHDVRRRARCQSASPSLQQTPAAVHIEQINADRKTYDASSNLRLPALTRELEIDYTALSLVAPEKNRFQIQAGRP